MLGSPSPRNDSEDSSRIAVATISDASTITGDSAFGRISRQMIQELLCPVTIAA